MDYVAPGKVMEHMIEAGEKKSGFSPASLLLKGALAGGLLGYATTLAFTAENQTGLPLAGAFIFPIGFIIIVLLGLELVTGNFALIPCAYYEKKSTFSAMMRNFAYVFAGNLFGSLLYAGLYVLVITKMGHELSNPMIEKLLAVSASKTTFYQEMAASGMVLVFLKAVFCNWMVTLGTVLAFTSQSTTGKIAAMSLPIFMFFAQGFEHAVVNMFVIPAGMLLGADVSFADWWLWNQIPVTIGNFIGGFALTGSTLYLLYKKR